MHRARLAACMLRIMLGASSTSCVTRRAVCFGKCLAPCTSCAMCFAHAYRACTSCACVCSCVVPVPVLVLMLVLVRLRLRVCHVHAHVVMVVRVCAMCVRTHHPQLSHVCVLHIVCVFVRLSLSLRACVVRQPGHNTRNHWAVLTHGFLCSGCRGISSQEFAIL